MRKKMMIILLMLTTTVLTCIPIKVEAMGSTIQMLNCNALLGSTQNQNSVAWLIQEILDIIKVAGPVIAAILSSVEIVQIIMSGDNDAMAKAQKKLITRLILIVLLFLLPVLTKFLLNIFGLTTDSICGLK